MNRRTTDEEKLRRRVRANFVGGVGGGLFALLVTASVFALFFTVLTFKDWLAFHRPLVLGYFIVCLILLGISLRLTLRSYRMVARAGEKAARHAMAKAQKSQEEDDAPNA